jgi:predicted permease
MSALATLREWVARLRGMAARGRRDDDLEQELRSHVELAADEARRRGAAPGEEHRAAAAAAGHVPQALEAMRDQRGLPWLDDLSRDLRHGVQLLRRAPAFTAAAVLSLALGIGANTAVFSFADALLLRPLAVPDPGGVVAVGSFDVGAGALMSSYGAVVASYREYVDIRDRSRSVADLVAFTSVGAAFARDPAASPVLSFGMLTSGNLLRAMRVRPSHGRDFLDEEDTTPGRDAVVILGHDFWRRLGADPGIVGRAVRLNGIPFTVIGVAPEGFHGLDQHTRFEFFVPLMMWPRLAGDAAANPLEARALRGLQIKGRLSPGISIAAARAELAGIGADLARQYPETSRNRVMTARTELENRMAQAPPVPVLLMMLGTLAAAVLVVSCANVAGLLASRAPVRAREIALRMAIGAGRFRVVRQLVTESLLIAACGGALGLAVAFAGVTLFRRFRFATDLPISPVFELDRRALAVSLAAALASVVLSGLGPAIRAARSNLDDVMKNAEAAGAGRRSRGRALLVAAQVAISVVLLAVATFTWRGFERRLAGGPGFRTDHLLLMSFNPALLGYDPGRTLQFFEELTPRARQVAGVRSAALASYVPMDGRPGRVAVQPEGWEFPPGTEYAAMPSSLVDEHYFETLGLPIVAGRAFHSTDTATAPLVAIVNEEVARRYWPGQDPVGKRLRLNDAPRPWLEIVGVARNSKYGFLTEPPREYVYLPFRQHQPRPMILLTRSDGDPASLAAPLRDLVRALDANLPIYNVRSFDEFYELRVVTLFSVLTNLIGAMGAMGMLLAIVGLYGLVAFAVNRRTREIGIRMAIGADRRAVLRMVLAQGLRTAVAGLAIGLVAGVAANRMMQGLFDGGAGGDGRIDVVAFIVVAAAVLAVTLTAAYIPARRATRINPTDSLRCE